MTFRELVEKNRSYRGYNPDRAVTKEELLDMVDCARITASTANHQVLKYRLVREPEETAAVQALTKWAGALPELHLPYPGTCPTAFIIICQDRVLGESLQRYQRDVGIAAQTILLRAAEMGLGGCMIASFAAGDLSAVLKLPENMSPVLVLAVGEPAETVRLVEPGEDGSVVYYRDEQNVHYVPKRKLEDIVL